MTYTGGKGRAFRPIISMMPPHKVYIETHLGSGAVMRHKRPADRNIGIDLDPRPLQSFVEPKATKIELVNADACDFLLRFSFEGDELIYADPPYWPATRRRKECYKHDYTIGDHKRLLNVLVSVPCRVMLSGYRSKYYDERLSEWERRDFQAVSQIGLVEESVWMNFEPGSDLHDYTFLGSNFREREALNRRRMTQLGKMKSLSKLERRAVLSDLAKTFPDEFRAATRFCKP